MQRSQLLKYILDVEQINIQQVDMLKLIRL